MTDPRMPDALDVILDAPFTFDPSRDITLHCPICGERYGHGILAFWMHVGVCHKARIAALPPVDADEGAK